MNFFQLIIAPFIFVIKQVFLLSYELTGNYGISIILLSFAISLLLLPVFMLIEKAKKRDDAVKKKMKPLLDEIKRCYKGQERYYYIKTLYRQHNFSQIRSLIPILSLLLQIPFFIAAYQFLANYGPLEGVGFLFINNLNAPDALFGTVNVLPIAMTLVNLITAYYYTRNGNATERNQMAAIAGLFLVLLFRLPSGLVLYWTMNNVFSFFRLFITNREVFEKTVDHDRVYASMFESLRMRFMLMLPKLRVTLIVIATVLLLGQLNWAFQHSFDDIVLRIFGSIGGSILITFFIFIITLLHPVEVSSNGKKVKDVLQSVWPRFIPLLVTVLVIVVLSQINWALNHNYKNIAQRLFFALAGSAMVSMLLAFIALFYQNHFTGLFENFKLRISALNKVYRFTFWTLLALAVASQINWALKFNFNDIIFRLSLVFSGSWFLVVLLANAINALRNDPQWSNTILKAKTQSFLPKLKWFYFILTFLAVGSQINWALRFNFDDIAIRLIGAVLGSFLITFFVLIIAITGEVRRNLVLKIQVPPKIAFALLFLTVYFYLAAKYYFNGVNHSLAILALMALIPTQLIGFLYFLRHNLVLNRMLYVLVSFLLLFNFFIQILNFYVVFTDANVDLVFFNVTFLIKDSTLLNIVSAGIVFTLITLPFYFSQVKVKLSETKIKGQFLIFALSILYIAGFVFFWNPLMVYSSSPETFGFSGISILKTNVVIFAIVLIISMLLYIVTPPKIKKFWLIFFLCLTIVSFLYSSIIPINMGTLQSHRFTDTSNLSAHFYIYLIEAFFLIGLLFGINILLKEKYSKIIVSSLLLLNIIPILQSRSAFKVGPQYSQSKPEMVSTKHTIPFSRDKENVVFLIVDMLQGWYLKSMIEENPELKQSFEGFIHYPNTVSISNYTNSSAPPILAGFNYTPDKLNLDSIHTLNQKIVASNEIFRDKVNSKGFYFTSTDIPWSQINKNTIDNYLPLWHTDWDYLKSVLNIGKTKELNYAVLWENAAFFCAPLFVKPRIYNNGTWMIDNKPTNENTGLTGKYNFLRALPYISTTNAEKPGFMLVWSNASHMPWDIIDKNGNLKQNVTPYENNKWIMLKIAEWLDWMKQNKVYDNTKIIILSDHGIRDATIDASIMIDNPFTPKESDKVPIIELLNFTPLLMVKDYHSSGLLKEDWRFMSNVDAYSIAFNEIDPTKMDPPISRTLNAFLVSWRIDGKNIQIPIEKSYEIKDNVYELKNWTLINK
ncbi:MAG: membrane protein insertase YidC [Salinivirgaceae bacterium]